MKATEHYGLEDLARDIIEERLLFETEESLTYWLAWAAGWSHKVDKRRAIGKLVRQVNAKLQREIAEDV